MTPVMPVKGVGILLRTKKNALVCRMTHAAPNVERLASFQTASAKRAQMKEKGDLVWE